MRFKILLIEDEENLADMVANFLAALGYDVTIRHNSCQALQLFKNQSDRFDMIVTDFNIPGFQGDQLIVECRKLQPNIPILLWTANRTITAQDVQQWGGNALLMKPFNLPDLVGIIRKLIKIET